MVPCDIKGQLKSFINSDLKRCILSTQHMTGKERFPIHDYCRKLGLNSKSGVEIEPDRKTIVVSKDIAPIIKPYVRKRAKEFVNLVGLPITKPSLDTIENDLKHLEKHFPDAKELYTLFRRESATGNVYTKTIHDVKLISNIIKNHPQAKDLTISHPLADWDPHWPKSYKKNIYIPNNIDRCFVSFDMVAGHPTALKLACPDLIKSCWKDFMDLHTDSDFIKKCKKQRSYIIGQTGLSGILKKLCEKELCDLDDYIGHNFSGGPVYMDNDEVVYEINDMTHDLINTIDLALHKYNRDFFTTEFFTLRQIPGTTWYYKELIDGKKIIKCVPPRKFMEMINVVDAL